MIDRLSGVTREILFSQSKNVQAIRFHDGRATFCTWARRDAKSDLWITERTGHTPTSKMLARYTRMAQMLADLDYEPFPCVLHAIPELAPKKRDECRACGPALSTKLIDASANGALNLEGFPLESTLCEGEDSNLHGSYPTSTSSLLASRDLSRSAAFLSPLDGRIRPFSSVGGVVDNKVDNARRSAAATLLEQAAALARVGAAAEVEALIGAARPLLMPGAEVKALKVRRR